MSWFLWVFWKTDGLGEGFESVRKLKFAFSIVRHWIQRSGSLKKAMSQILPGSSGTTYAATKELLEFYNGVSVTDLLSVRNVLYTNDLSSMPRHFVLLEVCFYVVGVSLLFHAIKNRQLYVWLGFFCK